MVHNVSLPSHANSVATDALKKCPRREAPVCDLPPVETTAVDTADVGGIPTEESRGKGRKQGHGHGHGHGHGLGRLKAAEHIPVAVLQKWIDSDSKSDISDDLTKILAERQAAEAKKSDEAEAAEEVKSDAEAAAVAADTAAEAVAETVAAETPVADTPETVLSGLDKLKETLSASTDPKAKILLALLDLLQQKKEVSSAA
jgi:hypothetical protein